jgi:hypothetical protein
MAVLDDEVTDEVALLGKDLVVYIPDTLDPASLSYVALIAEEDVASNETMLRMGLGAVPKEIESTERLVQLFVKVLFQTPGTDVYHKNIGGGLLRTRKRGTVSGDVSPVAAEISAAVTKAESDVKAMQTALDLPADETLVQAKVVHLNPDLNTQEIQVVVSLITLAGTRTYFNVSA